MIRKFMSLLLCVTLMTGMVSSYVMVKDVTAKTLDAPVVDVIMSEPTTMASNESSEKALEAAIKAVKSKITIPKEYSEFNYYYYGTNSYSGAYWNLNWRMPNVYSYIDVTLDKDNNFISYSTYDYSNKDRTIPSYLKNELQDEAEAFIKKIAPDIYPKIDFVSSNYDSIYDNSYTYSFQRKEKGIAFPDNSVSVRVNAATGDIMSASIEWLREAKIPSGSVKLTKDEATKIIGKNLNMKLAYKTNYYRIYDNNQNDFIKKAFLVYEPDIPYVSIDANTGEAYLTRSEWVEMDFSRKEAEADMAKTADEAAGTDTGMLTEEEIAKIRELEKLISKDKAIEIVTSNKYLHIDDNLLTYTATLNQSYNYTKANKSTYIWNISLRDNRPVNYSEKEDNYRAYANATVDAKTGKILSFYASVNNSYDHKAGKWLPVDIKYDREYGQEILEKFLNSQVKNRFTKTKLSFQGDDYVAYYKEDNVPVYGGYNYRYNRFNEGLEFTYNYIHGSVDGITGKIYNYNVNWDDDIIFESPKEAMSPKEAFKYYIDKDGYRLLYEINVINQYDPNYKSKERYYDYSEAYRVAYEVRLVYRPDISPSYISPFTGKQLDSNGEEYVTIKPYTYKDIDDTKENRDILLLSDMNIGFEGDNFYPEKVITEGEMNQLLDKLGHRSAYREDDYSSTKLITREELAYSFIESLGLDRLAKIRGIYKTGYSDEDKISPKYLGAVALAKGLELFPKENGSSFKPKNNITRREAVHLLFNFIKANQNY